MPATLQRGAPWYHSITVDVLLTVLNNSIFHPFIASLLPLCLRAAETPYSEPAFKNSVYWAIFICILHILGPVNRRIAYGRSREVDFEEEVIVVTGGASGLGKCLAEIYALRGATVAVLDIRASVMVDAVECANYYACDIGDPVAVKKAWATITKELGVPTILINNAGIVDGKPLIDLSPEEVEKTFRTNIISQFHLTSLFVPPLLEHPTGGTIVTVSSVLSRLGASQLSAYTASKAGLVAYHASLAAELAIHPKIKTILATPGQLTTDMFNGLEQGPIARFFAPIVEVQDLAMRIVKMIDSGNGGVISVPTYARWISCMDILPVGLQKMLRDLAGVDTAMSKFQPKATEQEQENSIVFVEKAGEALSTSA